MSMKERDYTHRDLCSATAGILEAFHEMSERDRNDKYDAETVEEIIEQFNKKHDELGAETPKVSID
jgi:hypothetical protein